MKKRSNCSILLSILTMAFIITLTPIPTYTLAYQQNGQQPELGINYLSTHYWYDGSYLNDSELDRDFSFFQDQGIKFIIISMVWSAMDGTTFGSYNYSRFENIKHVCEEAGKYNIKVIISFHTLMDKNSWTMPEWLSPRCFNTIFTNMSARQAWLDFLGSFTGYVKDVQNIDSYLMMNEPYRGSWACDVSIDDFVTLWGEMKSTITTQSLKPVSIKFNEYGLRSALHFNYDSRIYSLCDYIAVNYYEDKNSNSTTLQATIDDIQAHGNCKKIMISEFGLETNDTSEQHDYYDRNLALFRSLDINAIAPWFWRADYELGPPDANWTLPTTPTYNLALNISGYPRPAFFLLKNPPLGVQIVQPSKTTIELGEQLTLTTQASGGTGAYNYQWSVNETAVEGATTANFTFNPTSIGNFTIKCMITDVVELSLPSASTSVIILAVNPPDIPPTTPPSVRISDDTHARTPPPVPELTSLAIIVLLVMLSVVGNLLYLKKRKKNKNTCA